MAEWISNTNVYMKLEQREVRGKGLIARWRAQKATLPDHPTLVVLDWGSEATVELLAH